MTTARDVKRLVRPIIERHPQFVLDRRFLFASPIRHVLAGMFIDRCRSEELFNVFCVIDAAVGILDDLNLGNVPTIFHDTLQWNLTVPDIDMAVLEVFERRILPLVDCITNLKEFEILMLSEEKNAHFVTGGLQAILLSIALGDLCRASQMAKRKTAQLKSYQKKLNQYDLYTPKRVEDLHALLLRGDKGEMAAHLHELERRNIESLKLTKFHERTPFPLELM